MQRSPEAPWSFWWQRRRGPSLYSEPFVDELKYEGFSAKRQNKALCAAQHDKGFSEECQGAGCAAERRTRGAQFWIITLSISRTVVMARNSA